MTTRLEFSSDHDSTAANDNDNREAVVVVFMLLLVFVVFFFVVVLVFFTQAHQRRSSSTGCIRIRVSSTNLARSIRASLAIQASHGAFCVPMALAERGLWRQGSEPVSKYPNHGRHGRSAAGGFATKA